MKFQRKDYQIKFEWMEKNMVFFMGRNNLEGALI